MTFDFSPEQIDQRDRARQTAVQRLAPMAASIDASGEVPAPVLATLSSLNIWGDDMVSAVLMIEELAAVSAAGAAQAALGVSGPPAGLAGLSGVPAIRAPESRHYLALAAVCLGIGKAAVGEALAAARARGDRPAGEPGDPPHWALADAATEVDAARLLVHQTAAGRGLSAAAVFVHAAAAANRAVDAAVRIVGADGYRPGSVLERCLRDARAAWLVLGTEDQVRRTAADALLA